MAETKSLLLAAGLVAACLLTNCAGGGGDEAAAASARLEAQRHWKIQLDGVDGPTELGLDRMDIYLTEEEETYPEIYEMYGPDVVLVGVFPMELHVGYGEEFEKMVGRTIRIQASGGDPRDRKTSFVRVGNREVPVLGGSMTFDKVTGKWSGTEGDRTCWGKIELRVRGAAGEQTLRGTFAVNGVTWG